VGIFFLNLKILKNKKKMKKIEIDTWHAINGVNTFFYEKRSN